MEPVWHTQPQPLMHAVVCVCPLHAQHGFPQLHLLQFLSNNWNLWDERITSPVFGCHPRHRWRKATGASWVGDDTPVSTNSKFFLSFQCIANSLSRAGIFVTFVNIGNLFHHRKKEKSGDGEIFAVFVNVPITQRRTIFLLSQMCVVSPSLVWRRSIPLPFYLSAAHLSPPSEKALNFPKQCKKNGQRVYEHCKKTLKNSNKNFVNQNKKENCRFFILSAFVLEIMIDYTCAEGGCRTAPLGALRSRGEFEAKETHENMSKKVASRNCNFTPKLWIISCNG